MQVSVAMQPSEFQLELCELQSDQFLLSKSREKPENVWKFVSQERFPILKNAALTLLLLREKRKKMFVRWQREKLS